MVLGMSASRTHTITLPGHDMSHELDNEDRADMVRPLFEAFWETYYGSGWENEPPDMVLGDLIADLLHLADRVADEDGAPAHWENVLASAVRHFSEEVTDEEAERR